MFDHLVKAMDQLWLHYNVKPRIAIRTAYTDFEQRTGALNKVDMKMAGKCPVMHGGNTAMGTSNVDWWPNALNLDILNQHDTSLRQSAIPPKRPTG